MDYDVLVLGGGIAGMESALSLGDMGHRVLLLEREPTIGGKMILLSKVFPTLDCASCISTPKMAAAAHHPNITMQVSSEAQQVRRLPDGTFQVRVRKQATFVDASTCTGCQSCEQACTVSVPDRFNYDLVAHRAAHIAFPQAIPKKAVITRTGTSPCSDGCPAGVRAHGFVSLVRAGKVDAGFDLHMRDAPLPGCLGRVCYAPCEAACTRGSLEGSVTIRGIKRFMTDTYYADHQEPAEPDKRPTREQRIAIVGSGPAGLSAAYYLAQDGFPVMIFEAASQAGGMLRLGIPSYRLPREVLDRDIRNVTAQGVEIRTSSPVTDLDSLPKQGFSAVFLATGALEPKRMRIPGEDLEGVTDCMSFLKHVNLGPAPDLTGKTVMVVGGGNAAIDPARVALRLGAAKVILEYRRSRPEMPAHDWEIEAALNEGVELHALCNPIAFHGIDGTLREVESLRMELGEPDESGRRRPVPVPGSESRVAVDLVVLAIGLSPSATPFHQLALRKDGSIEVDPTSLQTSMPKVFAGGDVVTGPSMVVKAIAQGKQAAASIRRFLDGDEVDPAAAERLPRIEPEAVIERVGTVKRRPVIVAEAEQSESAPLSWEEIEPTMSASEAQGNAGRCLDCGTCCECEQCVSACPAGSIQLGMRDEYRDLHVGSVVLATGMNLFDAKRVPRLGHGRLPNVITAMQMERILAPTRPYNTVLRPSDGKIPDNIAYVLCAGSRDHTVGNPACSRVCCMYSIKQAQLLLGALPLADITLYYIDIRAFGKGYEEFYQQAKGMGVVFVKGKVAEVVPTEDGNMNVIYEDIENGGGVQQMEHDLVVLSVGLLPNPDALSLFGRDVLESDELAYIKEQDGDLEPGKTNLPGVFVAGAASAAKDIPDTILHAGAAAAQTAAYLERTRTGA
jgi:heterodisulfide reductase subunit A2